MTSHDWFVEHRTAYAARTLDREEERAFVDHLARCEECSREVERLAIDLGWLSMGVSPAAVRPGLLRRIADRTLGVGRWRWTHMTTTAVAASLLLAVVAYGAGRKERAGLREERRELQARLATMEQDREALSDTLSVMRSAGRVLQASFEMENREGGLLIFADERTHRWNIVVHGLPPAGPERVYQFWFITDDGMVRGATIHPDPAGPAFMTLGMPPTGGAVLGAALTVEPMDAVSGGPKGEEVVHLML